MKSYVLDASIILNYLFTETRDVKTLITTILKQADNNQVQLLTTSYFPIEVANGLRFKLKDPVMTKKILSKLIALPITYYSLTSSQLLQATKSSYTTGSTVYDTAYHILAIAHNAIFITCDQKYYKQSSKLGNIKLYGQSK